MVGENITIYEQQSLLGGSLDGALLPDGSYSLRGGGMLTTDQYECTWDLLSSIPSLEHPEQTVRDETVAFNTKHKAHSRARLVDRNRFKVDVTNMGFTMQDRMELLGLTEASEEKLGNSRIRTGYRRHLSKRTSGTCGRQPSPFSHGTARSG